MRIYQLKIVIILTVLFILLSLLTIKHYELNISDFSILHDNSFLSTDSLLEVPQVFKSTNLWRKQTKDPLVNLNGNNVNHSNIISNKEDENNRDRILSQWQWVVNVSQSTYMQNVKKKRILLTGLFRLDDEERNLPCHEPGLNFSRFCELVEDFWYDPQYQNYDDFDAVLIRRDWNYQFYEPRIPPSKITFFHIQESPYTFHQGDFRVNNPVLASYWRGSDIEVPYFKWVPYPPDKIVASQNLPKKNYAEGRNKLAAIVVSHCPTYNDRLGLVHELQKYIPIDIYGSCGTLRCGRGCFEMISKEYKFYLAFENANCRDYITEKFFENALGKEIVPVVLGAHPDDYKYAAPPNSYIHVEDFSSIKMLAEFLVTVDKNNTLYNEFFRWKGSGEIVNSHIDIFCRVCAFLFYADFNKPPRWPPDSYSWLKVNGCLKPGQHFWYTRQIHPHDS